jgi:Mg2+-importing ATPase
LLRITVVLSLVILITNLYFKKPLFDSVLFSLALAVGMAPELLPAIMTFAMSAGAKKMMKKHVIVKKLSSIFNFGEVNVLCTDKTGTITEGNVTVKNILDAEGNTSEKIRLYAYLNASLQKGFANPIDDAITSLNLSLSGYEKVDEVPYDFLRKRLSIAVKHEQEVFFVTKGAFSNILPICSYLETGSNAKEPIKDEARKTIEEQFVSYSEQGYRVLGLAYKEISSGKISRNDEQDMTFLGFILLEDPLKETTLSSIQRLEKLHIEVKIITGDNRYAANHAAKTIGIQNAIILTGDQLNELSPESLTVHAGNTNIFAEIEPHQKERIVKALQKSHFTVAYLGDGINDMAAINAADIGISTNNATDVAKEAADFVLLDKDLSVLANGILEGRKSFANSMKYIFINTGATFGNMFSVAGASLLLPFLPMLPKQILLTNLITDFPFLTIASDNVEEDQLSKPRKWDMKTIQNFMIVFGLHSSLFDFATFYLLYRYFHLKDSSFQTGWFLESAITEILILFIIRTHKSIINSKPGKLLMFTSSIALVVTAYLPVSPFADLLGLSIAHSQQVIAIVLILIAYIITGDLLKIIFFRVNDRLLRK